MCTYNLTFNDAIVEGAKKSFHTESAITIWMEQQIERLLRQIAVEDKREKMPLRKISVSDRIKALSNVPASSDNADYKEEMKDVLSYKYQ